jgi:cyclophilin family peptidyl-prolyl cis-trans isomerase
MRNTAVAFVLLILVAIGFVAIMSKVHPGNASPTPAEQDQIDSEKAKSDQQAAAQKSADAKKNLTTFDQVQAGAIHTTLVIADRGTIKIDLYPAAAPKTVAHVVDLCKKDFYKGILFHRVVPGFVAQAGDPKSKTVNGKSIANVDPSETGLGGGGSGTSVPLEAKLPHTKYSIGLARSNSPDSGDSQFYINLKDNNSLDGGYCVFGMITSGQDVADKIQQGDKITSFSVQ